MRKKELLRAMNWIFWLMFWRSMKKSIIKLMLRILLKQTSTNQISQRPMKLAIISASFIFCLLSSNNASSQSDSSDSSFNFINVETGFLNDGYHALGLRIYAEYRLQFSAHWSFGLGLDNSFYLTRSANNEAGEGSNHSVEIPSNLNILSFNAYYNLPFRDNKFYLRPGIGISEVMVRWDGHQETGLAINFNLPLGIRVTPNVYITTSILPILFPFNRLYISGMNVETSDSFHAFSLLPIGVDIRF